MTEIEKAIAAFEAVEADEDKHIFTFKTRRFYAVAGTACKEALAALREKQERGKGCEFCKKELDDYPYIYACGNCDSSGTVYTPAFCPMCGRPLSEK